MNKTTTKTTNKTKTKPKSEDDMLIEGVTCVAGMLLAAILVVIIQPIISAPNFGANILFFIVGGWLFLLLGGLLGIRIF